jgi:hypothetical protein
LIAAEEVVERIAFLEECKGAWRGRLHIRAEPQIQGVKNTNAIGKPARVSGACFRKVTQSRLSDIHPTSHVTFEDQFCELDTFSAGPSSIYAKSPSDSLWASSTRINDLV